MLKSLVSCALVYPTSSVLFCFFILQFIPDARGREANGLREKISELEGKVREHERMFWVSEKLRENISEELTQKIKIEIKKTKLLYKAAFKVDMPDEYVPDVSCGIFGPDEIGDERSPSGCQESGPSGVVDALPGTPCSGENWEDVPLSKWKKGGRREKSCKSMTGKK